MLCDVYIMPLWRFKAGDFQLPDSSSVTAPSRGIWKTAPLRAVNHLLARDSVRRIRRSVEAENGVSIAWYDEGELVGHRSGCEFQALRAYAHWLDSRVDAGRFVAPPDGNYYKHSAWKEKQRTARFHQIVDHDCCYGYYLPCRFEQLARVEPRKMDRWTFLRAVGSSFCLLEELRQIGAILDRAGHTHFTSAVVRGEVLAGHRQLTELAELSRLHGLPLILSRQGVSQRTQADLHRRANAFWQPTATANVS